MQLFDDSTPPTNPPIAADFPAGVSAKDVPPWFGGGGPAISAGKVWGLATGEVLLLMGGLGLVVYLMMRKV